MSEKLDTGGPAFPRTMSADHGFINDPGDPGMTLLDYFAARAPEPWIEESYRCDANVALERECVKRYEWALAMLAARYRAMSQIEREAAK